MTRDVQICDEAEISYLGAPISLFIKFVSNLAASLFPLLPQLSAAAAVQGGPFLLLLRGLRSSA